MSLLKWNIKTVAILLLSFIVSSCTTTTIQTNHPIKSTANLSVADRTYTQLQQAIPMYQDAVLHPWATLPSGIKLKPGIKNIHVIALRGRLKATGELKPEDDTELTLYDKSVTEAVKRFQLSHGLEPTGAVGPQTLSELNVPPSERLQQIQVNMRRWAKLSHELGDRYILVNVPDYRLQVVENGEIVLSMKAVVGKPERPTPEIFSKVTRIVFNPYWNVPNSIAEEDIVPKVINNPNYLEEMHIEILNQQTEDATILSSRDIDWQSIELNGFPYHFRQEPGSENALGLVKFEFDNSHDVYLHDTPAKNLFELSKRDFSSGCIRLEKPFELANYLMKDDPTWTEDKMQDILDTGKTRYIKASAPTEIIIAYLTAWTDESGNVQFRDDVYLEDDLLLDESLADL
jgi:murein L,D-transpeptidase YcbB/YkuD